MSQLEIERKFLVKNQDFIRQSFQNQRMTQGFLSTVPERTVRIRSIGQKGYITVKGIGNKSGTTRFEWEKEIQLEEANSLLELCEPVVIDKTRYYCKQGAHVFEVDVFHGRNDGLIVAEIELKEENETFESPDWLGEEITGLNKYYNSSLSKQPYTDW